MASVVWQLLFVLVLQILPSMMSRDCSGCTHGQFQVIQSGGRCRLEICCGRMWKMVVIRNDCRNDVNCEQLCNHSSGTASWSNNLPEKGMECLVGSIPCIVNETHPWCRNPAPQATIITCQAATNDIHSSMTDSVFTSMTMRSTIAFNSSSMTDSVFTSMTMRSTIAFNSSSMTDSEFTSMTMRSTIAFNTSSMTNFVSQPATMFSIHMSSTATARTSAVDNMNGQSSNLLYVIIVAPMTVVTAIAVVVAMATAIVLYRKRKKEQQYQMNESTDISMHNSVNNPAASSDGCHPPLATTDEGQEVGITLTNPLYDVEFEDTERKSGTHEYEHVDSDLIGPRDYEIPVAHSVPPVSEYSTLNMTTRYATLEPFIGKETPELSQSGDEYSHLDHPK